MNKEVTTLFKTFLIHVLKFQVSAVDKQRTVNFSLVLILTVVFIVLLRQKHCSWK